MEHVRREIAKAELAVPFRASESHVHHTWARTFQSRPELYIQPESLEEVQQVVNLARRCRRRIVVVGCGHSPSDLTCSSSWMVNLDNYSSVLKVDPARKTLLAEGGIRLRQLNLEANQHGLTMPNLGSIDDQSIVGAITTATHGSSLWHGLLSESVRALRIVLSNGHAVRCSKDHNPDLFRAALVSLGALGIIVEVEFKMIPACNIEWTQQLHTLDDILDRWFTSLWTQKEYTRVWWLPYMKRAIVWSAEKTEKPLRPPPTSWYGGSVGFHTYHNLLWLSNYIPWILPAVEWFVFGMQYGFRPGVSTSAVEELRTGLLMNCLYSQFVNEWALPLGKGPEAISRLSAWINREPGGGNIPFSAKGLWVHCPIEVRVSDSSKTTQPRPWLDNTVPDGPTLYLNATLYRPHLQDPPCHERYYEAFEWLMRDLGGKPHYAKNFAFTTARDIQGMLDDNLRRWVKIRNECDPEGMFLGAWHRRVLGIGQSSPLPLSEHEVSRTKATNGGQVWVGEVPGGNFLGPPMPLTETAETHSASSSASSFDVLHVAEAEKSTFLHGLDDDDYSELTIRNERRHHAHATDSFTETQVFDKM